MTENDAVELLPWFLNGTLEDEERREVEDWIRRSERVRDELETWREAWRTRAAIPPGEILVAYLEDRLPRDSRRRVEELLEVSEPTREALEMLREGRPDEPTGRDEPTVRVLGWPAGAADQARGPSFALPLAAALGAAVFTSLLWWFAGVGPEPPPAGVDVAVVELVPGEPRVRGDADGVEVGERFVAVLLTDDLEPADDLSVRVLDARGHRRLDVSDVDRGNDGVISLLLPRPDGPTPHSIVVLDADGRELERFRLQLAPPPASTP